MATNQAGSPSVRPNDVNTGKTSSGKNIVAIAGETSGRENGVAVELNIRNEEAAESKGVISSVIRNEAAGEPHGDARVSSEVQPITAVIALVIYWFTTTMAVKPITMVTTLVFYQLATITSTLASLIAFSVCRQLASVCSARLPLSRAQLLTYASCAESVASSVKPFKDTQDMSIYEGLLVADDSDEYGGNYCSGLQDSVFGCTCLRLGSSK